MPFVARENSRFSLSGRKFSFFTLGTRTMILILFLGLCSPVSLNRHTTKWCCSLTSLNSSVLVDCSSKNLKDIPPKLPTNVTELNLSGNQIKNFSAIFLRRLLNVTFIDLNHNLIKDWDATPLRSCSSLKTLLLDGNHLTSVPKYLPQTLTKLSLESNQINSIRPEDFQGLPNIESINLNNNCYFHSNCNKGLEIENGTFQKLTCLTNISLTKNRLEKIPEDLPKSLVYLKLLLNTIPHIGSRDLKGLTSLRFLDLSGNCPFCPNTPFPCKPCGDRDRGRGLEIHPQAFDSLIQLEELRLSGNSLETVNSTWFEKLPRLRFLFMSFNFLVGEIQSGHFLSVLPHVEVLELSYNNLRKDLSPRLHISPHFANLTSLRSLHLEGHYFTSLYSEDLKPLFNLQNLTVLNLGVNFIQEIDFSFMRKFNNLSVVTLVENQVHLLSRPDHGCCLTCGLGGYSAPSDPPILSRPFIHVDEDYRIYTPALKPECIETGNVLDLSRNSIFSINSTLFGNMENVTCLNLSSNFIGGNFKDSEFRNFPKLKYLDLSHNNVYLSSDQAFRELKHLEILDLSHNKHYFQVVGLNHTLMFIRHLKSLKVLHLSINEISSLTDPYMDSSSLQKLYFAGNRLDMMWQNSKGFYLFKNLTRLETLDLSWNMLKTIPNTVYENLPETLRVLFLNQNGMVSFNWTVLKRLPCLEQLHLSKNRLVHVPKTLSTLTRRLELLDLSHNKIAHLSGSLLAGMESLRLLDLSFNGLRTLNDSSFHMAQPASLETLRLNNNLFRCTCDLLDFILWVRSSSVTLPDLLTRTLCHQPESKRGKSIMLSEMEICMNSDIAQIMYALTSSMVILFLFIATCAHLFYWDVSYIFSFLSAKVRIQRPQSAQYVYNAFVMYDTKDPLVADWVLRHMRAKLEEHRGGEKLRPLCLEERDWLPGTPVMDNLSQSIRLSRKTVFVVTEGFLSSSLFKMAVFLAHQRLLEEGVDVMVLLLLQPVLLRSRILGLRRCLSQRSVLQWPANPAAHSWFWQQLRSAVRTERQAKHSTLHRKYFYGR